MTSSSNRDKWHVATALVPEGQFLLGGDDLGDTLSYCTEAVAGGLLPVSPVSCVSTVSGTTVSVDWPPVDGDTADRYVIYARSAATASEAWKGSVALGTTTFSTSEINPAETAWLVKSRTTLADGTQVFSDGVPCSGSDVEFVAGDSAGEAFVVTGAEIIDDSTIFATLEDGEELVTFPSGGFYSPVCGELIDSSMEPSVWYAWTPGTVGTFELALASPDWLGSLAVYEPSGLVGDLADSIVDCDLTAAEDTPISLDVADADTTYYIQVFASTDSATARHPVLVSGPLPSRSASYSPNA